MDLSTSVFEKLINRGERAERSSTRRAIRESFSSPKSPYWTLTLDNRGVFHERMRAAERAGAVRLEWSRLGGDDRPLEAVVLLDLMRLASHLGRRTVAEQVQVARDILSPWMETSPPIQEILSIWQNLRAIRGMGPEAASDLADAARLIAYLQEQPAEDRFLRQVSAALFSDSKRIEALERHVDVLTAEELRAPARHAEEIFARIGLRKEPLPFLLAGQGLILLRDGSCPIVRPYVGVSPSVIAGYVGAPSWLLTVENLTTFHMAAIALGARSDGLIIYTGGMPSPAWCRAYAILRSALPVASTPYHWGDIDDGGYRIAWIVSQAYSKGAALQPWLMDPGTCGGRLMEIPAATKAAMIRNATKLGWAEVADGLGEVGALAACEQESIPIRLPSRLAL